MPRVILLALTILAISGVATTFGADVDLRGVIDLNHNYIPLPPRDAAPPANLQTVSNPYWAPDLKAIRQVEDEIGTLSNFTQFPGFNCPDWNINEFARYYWGYTTGQGQHIIIGQLRLPAKDQEGEVGVHIASQPNRLDNGGCTIANAFFDADASKLYFIRWGGYFPDVGRGGPVGAQD